MTESLDVMARGILESGDIKEFIKFYKDNKKNVHLHKSFEDDEDVSFPMILVQTFRKIEATRVELSAMPVEDYVECLQLMKVQGNANLDFQDETGRTVCHWCVLLQSQVLLGEALNLGCDPLIQDQEGQTIVHLSVRLGCQSSLETVKNHTLTSAVFEEASVCSGATPLIYATQIGAMETVKKLIQLSVDPNRQENNKYKRTALHYALFTNRLDIFEELLKAGAKPNIMDYNKKTILDRVAKYPHEKYLRLTALYSSGEVFSTIDPENNEKVTPLMAACQNDDTDTVDQLLDKGIDTELTDEDSRTALHHCAEHRNTACANRLINKNPNLIQMKDKNGFTTLHLATVSGNIPLLVHLLDKGAEINCLDNEGHTCLHWAVVCCQLEAIDLLIERKAELSLPDEYGAHPLHYATQAFADPEGDLKGPAVLRRLLNNDCPVDCVDKEDRTPLLWASSLGVAECCTMLIESKASLEHQDKAGLTALHCAASRSQYDVIDLLLDKFHMDVNCQDSNGCSPLFYAVTLKHVAIVELLLSRKCDPNHQDQHGRSPSHCAAVKGQVEILDMLEKSGADLWLKNDKDVFPLHEACESNHLEVAKFILNRNSEEENEERVNELTSQGYTCLHLAAEAGSVGICELLVENGAQVNVVTPGEDNSGKTALDLASSDDVREFLKEHGAITSEEIFRKIAEDEAAARAAEEAAAAALVEQEEHPTGDIDDEGKMGTDDTLNEQDVNDENIAKKGQDEEDGSPLKSPSSPQKSSSAVQNGIDGEDLDSPSSPVKHARFSRSAQIPVKSAGFSQHQKTPIKSKNQTDGHPQTAKGVKSSARSGQPNQTKTSATASTGVQRSISRPGKLASNPNLGNKSATPGRTVSSSGPVRKNAGPRNGYAASNSLNTLPQIKGPDERRAGSDTSSVSTLRNNRPQIQTAPASLENFRAGYPAPKKKNNISSQITESVRQFENVRTEMREMSKIKRMQIFNGYVSDKGMLEALRQEYQRNYLLAQISDQSTGGKPQAIRSDTSSEIADSSLPSPRESRPPDDELEGNIRRTRELYEQVQRQADETLRQARQINTVLCDDLQKKRIAVYANNARKTRPSTTKKTMTDVQQRPISVVITDHIRQERLKKAYSSPAKNSSTSPPTMNTEKTNAAQSDT